MVTKKLVVGDQKNGGWPKNSFPHPAFGSSNEDGFLAIIRELQLANAIQNLAYRLLLHEKWGKMSVFW